MTKFKETLKVIEEGLLKPMSAAEIKQIDAENYKERIDEILLRSTKNADGSIDVIGPVYLSNPNLKKLPLKFNKVSGYFECSYNQLTSLEGAPKEVGGDFWCSHNQLTSLDGSPEKVGGNFGCHSNQLTSLEGAPKDIGESFWCSNNKVEFTEEQVRAVCNVKGIVRV